jgi:hypothetical protein
VGEVDAIAGQAESDPEEVGLSQGHLVRPFDSLARGESALVDQASVDPDEPAEVYVLGVVRAEDRRPIVAVPEDHLDLIGRTRVGERWEGDRQRQQHRNQKQLLHPILLVVTVL